MKQFIFDLDGTLTKEETLPKIAQAFNVQAQIDNLTQETIAGNIPFIESFISRVGILGKLPVDKIARLLEQIEIYENLNAFIQAHSNQCCIATGNLECWISKLVAKVGCETFSSSGILQDNNVLKLTHILKKESIVKAYQAQGQKVIFIGDGNNDVEAMRLADVSIASGLTHKPSPGVLSIADYAIFSEEALCRLLYQLL
ncbi:HAD-IB family phosphatase [Helicobacter sp. MIT 21-1697]|uniref:HAD-IB family phosphatase n=1 Tax=Helicobacter sp. MIT 21-1697 TaxID=2993733 RepID=UPI00224AAD51|nr:HAD-IB family phosphatase [Helicobacter sp. MIT 21-1697]MCX2716482.1 HAD-IB family phosphatase [Helicobacter sp. MIT 21-1697]